MSTTETTTALAVMVHGELQRGSEFALALDNLRVAAQGVVVRDRDTYQQACDLCARAARDASAIIAAAEPERLRLRAQLDQLLAKRDQMVALFQSAVDRLEAETRKWHFAEKQAAKAEQDLRNRGKHLEDRVVIVPDLPSTPGRRIVPHYRWKVINIKRMKREFMMPDVTVISRKLHDDKDPEKSEKAIGGIHVWIE